MTWLIVALVVVGLPVAALLFGVDSRDGHDWQSSDDSPGPLPGGGLAPTHMAGAGGTAWLVHPHEHVKQR
ncbi:MAG: hypothetical protein ABSD97_05005 [Acidimicrobiales bacterium]|jgi:hypothetical protein